MVTDVAWWECPLHLRVSLPSGVLYLVEGLLGENWLGFKKNQKNEEIELSRFIILLFLHTQYVFFCFEKLSLLENEMKNSHCC